MATITSTNPKCKACDKTVYLVDKLTADNKVYHKACFRCHHCNGTLKVFLLFSNSLLFEFLSGLKGSDVYNLNFSEQI